MKTKQTAAGVFVTFYLLTQAQEPGIPHPILDALMKRLAKKMQFEETRLVSTRESPRKPETQSSPHHSSK